jgi:hypothetical protein
MSTLDDLTHTQITGHCARGDEHAKEGRYTEALGEYWQAWDLLPGEKTEWEAATWILAAVGDVNFLSGDYAVGRDNLVNAMRCPDAVGNPFLHLRLGQCHFELGELDRAADELMRAYMGAGEDIFEEQDKKYLAFLRTRAEGIEAPKKGWRFWR